LDTPPGLQGFRWPAEWEPHAATWLSWPHNPETWPGRLEAVEQAFAGLVEALAPHEEVRINVGSEALEERARGVLRARGVDPDQGVRFFRVATDDAWVRDHGPVFVVRGEGPGREFAIVDFEFDAWGGKYPPWGRDAAVARTLAERLGVPSFDPGLVLEGGSIDGDGAGTLLTTESCLLHPNRSRVGGAPRSRSELERRLAECLGAERVLWLGDGIAGDDTDGHVDDITRFVAPSCVVTAVEANASDANYRPLRENLGRLRAMRDAAGNGFEIVELPMPPPIVVDGARCPASYANFYLANGVALVPSFGVPSDEGAVAILRELLSPREIVAVPSQDLIVGLGSVHCLTQSQPA
jgi:agmatine deiminase